MVTSEVIDISIQLFKILKEIHRAKLTYNDMKPKNVMIDHTPDHKIKVTLIDFGLVKSFIDKKGNHVPENQQIDFFEGNVLFASANQMNFN